MRAMPPRQNCAQRRRRSSRSSTRPCRSARHSTWARIIGSWCDVPITMPYSSASARVQRVVVVERVAPHRRPQVVALQAQDQLEDVRVELAVEAAELLARPAGERRRLVVDEDAAVPHRRLAAACSGRRATNSARWLPHRHVGPPVPGRDADLLRQVVDAEDRAALVAAGDDQRAVDAGPGPGDDGGDRRLPLSADRPTGPSCRRLHQPIEERAAADDPTMTMSPGVGPTLSGRGGSR